jgi:hypothetical protein
MAQRTEEGKVLRVLCPLKDYPYVLTRAQDYPESKQILAKLAGKNRHLRKANISEVGSTSSLCCVKYRGYIMYGEESMYIDGLNGPEANRSTK